MKQCITCVNFIECGTIDHINSSGTEGRHGDCEKVGYLNYISPEEKYRWNLSLDKAEKINRCNEYQTKEQPNE